MIRLPPSPELQRIFDDRTAAIYRFMVSRVDDKNKAGASGGTGRFVPFTHEQFALWVLESIGGSAECMVQCAYCNRWLSVATFVVDHRIPLGWPWSGSPALDNLALSCSSCNQRKGCMSDDGFRKLVHWATVCLDRRDLSDMLRRMAAAGIARRLEGTNPSRRIERGMSNSSALQHRQEATTSLFAQSA